MNLLNELIKTTGLNQTEFAKKVGAKQSQINRNLKYGGDMKFSTFKKYAEIFGIKNLEIQENNSMITIVFK